MDVIDFDRFEERAAIMEFDGGLSRFKAETLAAEAQGFTRWQVMEAKRENDKRNSQRGGDNGSTPARNAAHDMPAVQPATQEEKRFVPERDVQAGRDRLEMLALRV